MWERYIELGIAHRTLGGEVNPCSLAAGFISKQGLEEDFRNYSHKRHAFIYVLQGRGTYIDKEGKHYVLEKGSWFHRFPNILHTTLIDPKSDWLEYFIDIPGEITDPFFKLGYMQYAVPVGVNPSAFYCLEEFVNILTTLKHGSEDECRLLIPLMIQSQMRIIQCENQINPAQPSAKNIVDEACQYFSEHVHERFSIQEYCKRKGFGYEKFRKDFSRVVGLSPSKYCLRRRMDRALDLLQIRNPNLTMEEISDKLGYSSSFEFSSQFKEIHGLSPTSYRKKYL